MCLVASTRGIQRAEQGAGPGQAHRAGKGAAESGEHCGNNKWNKGRMRSAGILNKAHTRFPIYDREPPKGRYPKDLTGRGEAAAANPARRWGRNLRAHY